FVEIGTNKPLFLHRTGSNVVNGRYYVDHDPTHVIGHYSSTRAIDVAGLRRAYAALAAMPVGKATKGSPLRPGPARPLPRYSFASFADTSDRNLGAGTGDVAALVASLNAQGWWPTELKV